MERVAGVKWKSPLPEMAPLGSHQARPNLEENAWRENYNLVAIVCRKIYGNLGEHTYEKNK